MNVEKGIITSMKFDQNDYLNWYIPRMRQAKAEDKINLSSSGVRPFRVDPATLPDGPEFTMAQRFEEALALWLGIGPDEVLFTPGGTGGTLLTLLCLADSDSTIVMEQPMYEPMVRQAARLGRMVRLERRFEEGWRLPLERAWELMDDSTAVVSITEPTNPSGTYSHPDEVLELAKMAARRGAYLLVNEVYRGFSNRSSFHGMTDNLLVVNSLSKLLGGYQFRLGWLSGNPELIGRLRMGHVNMGIATAPGAAAGLVVLEKAEEIRQETMRVSQWGLPVVDAWVQATPGIDWKKPEGPGFGAIALPEGVDDVAFGDHLYDQRGVLSVPGTWFEAPGTLRLSWLQVGDRLEEGLAIIADALTSWKGEGGG